MTQITELTGANGFFTGVFFFIYNLNLLLGNGIVLVASYNNVSNQTLFYVLTAVSFAGTLLIFLAPKPSPPPEMEQKGPLQHVHHISLSEWATHLINLAKQPWTKLLGFYMAEQGITNAFSVGVLPALTEGSVTEIAYLFLAYGGVGCIASLVSGPLFDKWGWQWLIGFQLACTIVVHVVTIGTYYGDWNNRWYIVSCGFASFADNFANSINNMTISKVIN